MLRQRCDALGVTLVDAPLARSPVEAELGTLNVMVGASEATFAALLPVLHCFAENVLHAGEPGAGHVRWPARWAMARSSCRLWSRRRSNWVA